MTGSTLRKSREEESEDGTAEPIPKRQCRGPVDPKYVGVSTLYAVEFVQQPPAFPFENCKFDVALCLLSHDRNIVVKGTDSGLWRLKISLLRAAAPTTSKDNNNKDAKAEEEIPYSSDAYRIEASSSYIDCDGNYLLDENGLCKFSMQVDSPNKQDDFGHQLQLKLEAVQAHKPAMRCMGLSHPFNVVSYHLVLSEGMVDEWMRDKGGKQNSIELSVFLGTFSSMNPVLNNQVPLKLELYYEDGEKVPRQGILEVDNEETNEIDPRTGRCKLRCRISELSFKHGKQRFRIRIEPDVDRDSSCFNVSSVMTNPFFVKSKVNFHRLNKASLKHSKNSSLGLSRRSGQQPRDRYQLTAPVPAVAKCSPKETQTPFSVPLLLSLGCVDIVGDSTCKAVVDEFGWPRLDQSIPANALALHHVKSSNSDGLDAITNAGHKLAMSNKAISSGIKSMSTSTGDCMLEFVKQPPSFPFAHCNFEMSVCLIRHDTLSLDSAGQTSALVTGASELSNWKLSITLVHETEPSREVGSALLQSSRALDSSKDSSSANGTETDSTKAKSNGDDDGTSSYQVMPVLPKELSDDQTFKFDASGICKFSMNVDLLSAGTDNFDRFQVKIVATNHGGDEKKSCVLFSYPIKLVRYHLVLSQGMELEWMRDKGGKHNLLEVYVQLMAPGSLSPVLRRLVPLKLELYYEDGEKVPKQSILEVDEKDGNMIDPSTGICHIQCRVTEVSFKHRKRKFRIRVIPDVSRDSSCFHIASVMTNPFFVKSKINAHRIRAKEQAAKKVAQEAIERGVSPSEAAAKAAELLKPFANQVLGERSQETPATPAVARLAPWNSTSLSASSRGSVNELLALGCVDVVGDSTNPIIVSAFGWPQLDPAKPADALAIAQLEKKKTDEKKGDLPADQVGALNTTSQKIVPFTQLSLSLGIGEGTAPGTLSTTTAKECTATSSSTATMSFPVYRSVGGGPILENQTPTCFQLPAMSPDVTSTIPELRKDNISEWLPMLRRELGRLETYDRLALSSFQTSQGVNGATGNPAAPIPLSQMQNAGVQSGNTLSSNHTDARAMNWLPTGSLPWLPGNPFFARPSVSIGFEPQTNNSSSALSTSSTVPKRSQTINSEFLDVLATTATNSDPHYDGNSASTQRKDSRSSTVKENCSSASTNRTDSLETVTTSFEGQSVSSPDANASTSPMQTSNVKEPVVDATAVGRSTSNNAADKLPSQTAAKQGLVREDTITALIRHPTMLQDELLANSDNTKLEPTNPAGLKDLLSKNTLQFVSDLNDGASESQITRILARPQPEGLPCFDNNNTLLGFYRLAYTFDPVDPSNTDIVRVGELQSVVQKSSGKSVVKLGSKLAQTGEAAARTALVRAYDLKGNVELKKASW